MMSKNLVAGVVKTSGIIDQLGYEQLKALRLIRDAPDTEGAEICGMSDCSFDELAGLEQFGLIDLGMERLKLNALHPTLTNAGVAVLREVDGVVA